MNRTFTVVVDNDDYHQGEPFDFDDVRKALQGHGCSPECETRSFRVMKIREEIPGDSL